MKASTNSNAGVTYRLPISFLRRLTRIVACPYSQAMVQMLQRVYYTDDPIDEIIADTKEQMDTIACE